MADKEPRQPTHRAYSAGQSRRLFSFATMAPDLDLSKRQSGSPLQPSVVSPFYRFRSYQLVCHTHGLLADALCVPEKRVKTASHDFFLEIGKMLRRAVFQQTSEPVKTMLDALLGKTHTVARHGRRHFDEVVDVGLHNGVDISGRVVGLSAQRSLRLIEVPAERFRHSG